MRPLVSIALTLLVFSAPAFADEAGGNDGLALAARVGTLSPTLARVHKAELARFLNGDAHVASGAAAFAVTAKSVQCRVSDVDITEHSCTLAFGSRTVTIKDREAQALFATLGEVGVRAEGAAGSMYREVDGLSCKIDPQAIGQEGGSGAECTFTGAQ
jgi:hypothetical protein